jgi:hypothetical protein
LRRERIGRRVGGRSLPLMWPIYDPLGPSTRGWVPLSRLSHSPAGQRAFHDHKALQSLF